MFNAVAGSKCCNNDLTTIKKRDAERIRLPRVAGCGCKRCMCECVYVCMRRYKVCLHDSRSGSSSEDDNVMDEKRELAQDDPRQ